MVGTVLRVPRGVMLPVVCCAVLAASAGGCARVVGGTARAGDPQPRPAAPIPVADLLIEPSRFPAQYPAAVVPKKDIDRVLGEIDGVPAGSAVTPPECAPLPQLAEQKAAVQGADDSGARLTVTVIRPVASVRARVAQLGDCPSFSTSTGEAGEVSTVTVTLPPAPPVDADDGYAVDQTVTSTSSESSDTRTLTLVALVRDVQVTASWQQQGSSADSPDTQALDTVFTDAVLTVRQKIPR